MEEFGVHSEVGVLHQIIVHRPGLELSRLTPSNVDALLFDDILWVKKAREEHDAFVGVLEDRHIKVHHLDQLLTETLEQPEARKYVFDHLCTEERLGSALVGPLRQLAESADPNILAKYLIGGITKSDLDIDGVESLTWSALTHDDFILTPLPNHLFPRDNSCWIYDGVSINAMAKVARQRETS